MGADSPQRQRRHAKKLERQRRRQAERRKPPAMTIGPLGPQIAFDPRDGPPRVSSGPKLSMILLELLRPFLHKTERTLKEMRTGISLAAAVWNATVLEQEGENGWQVLTDSIREHSGGDAPEILQVATAMRDQKLDRYAADRRTVLSWTVTERGDTFDVRVVSGRTEDD